MLRRGVIGVVGVALLLGACSDDDGAARAGTDERSTTTTTAPGEPAPSLTEAGARLAAGALDDAPHYELTARIDPASGAVDGHETVTIPAPDDGDLRFRVFPNLPQLDAGFTVRDVTLDGAPIEPVLDQGLMVLPRPSGSPADEPVVVSMSFSYVAPELRRSGLPLQAATIGLISRQPSGIALGHWFPIWVPDGLSVDPNPGGFGDISAFPAAVFDARLTVPRGTELVSGGVGVETRERARRTTYVEEGTGLRDLAVFAGPELASEEVVVGDVTVRAVGPDAGELTDVVEDSASAIELFSELYVPYPWTEYDLVLNELGLGVGGAEWPGMAWLASPSPEVVAHEAAHEWWHALVGNDSVAAPAVDEPLAEYSTCLWIRATFPDAGSDCVETADPPSVPIDRPTTGFESPDEYGDLVYGTAPGFYMALADLVGEDVVLDGLRAVVEEHAYGIVTTDDLRSALAAAAPSDQEAEVVALFDAWFHAGTV